MRNYTLGDAVARYKRACGYSVLHPMGWDAFGLPAENAARERGVHPAAWTRQNIAAMRTELKRMGLSIDWSREFATCDVGYYGQQQRLFLALLEAGLVAAGLTGAWVRTVQGLIFLIAIVFYLFVEQPARRASFFARFRSRPQSRQDIIRMEEP